MWLGDTYWKGFAIIVALTTMTWKVNSCCGIKSTGAKYRFYTMVDSQVTSCCIALLRTGEYWTEPFFGKWSSLYQGVLIFLMNQTVRSPVIIHSQSNKAIRLRSVNTPSFGEVYNSIPASSSRLTVYENKAWWPTGRNTNTQFSFNILLTSAISCCSSRLVNVLCVSLVTGGLCRFLCTVIWRHAIIPQFKKKKNYMQTLIFFSPALCTNLTVLFFACFDAWSLFKLATRRADMRQGLLVENYQQMFQMARARAK